MFSNRHLFSTLTLTALLSAAMVYSASAVTFYGPTDAPNGAEGSDATKAVPKARRGAIVNVVEAAHVAKMKKAASKAKRALVTRTKRKDERSRFYVFPERMFQSTRRGPAGLHFTPRARAIFDPLLVLKKSFRGQMTTSHMNPVLR